MGIMITDYNAVCNLGDNIGDIFNNACLGDTSNFEVTSDIIKDKSVRLGRIKAELPKIDDINFDLRCNKLLLKAFEKIDTDTLFKKYDKNRIAVVCATTNTGVQEYEYSNNVEHSKISNPAFFIKKYFNLNNFTASVSTACSSGIKAFSTGIHLLNSNFADVVMVIGTDAISKVPVFGFDSLEILSPNPSIPFSKNRSGMNIGEGAGVFILEKDAKEGIQILGIGETTDYYHSTTPDPDAKDAVLAIDIALKKADLKPCDIDYINLHGTGTIANDLMEATAINKIFKDNVKSSSTKPLTGHCLGSASVIETALCSKLVEKKNTVLLPHIFDDEYDPDIPKINLVKIGDRAVVKNVLCTSFGFGGTNTAIILGGINA